MLHEKNSLFLFSSVPSFITIFITINSIKYSITKVFKYKCPFNCYTLR